MTLHNHWANLNPNTGQLLLAGLNGNGRRLRDFDLDTPAPRIGLAYALTQERKTIMRSGFGISTPVAQDQTIELAAHHIQFLNRSAYFAL